MSGLFPEKIRNFLNYFHSARDRVNHNQIAQTYARNQTGACEPFSRSYTDSFARMLTTFGRRVVTKALARQLGTGFRFQRCRWNFPAPAYDLDGREMR
jgi:hypothetical protein